MNKKSFRKILTLFTLLSFLGSLFPCSCFADATLGTLSQEPQTQSSAHDCCDQEDSKQSSGKDDFCCSGCNVFLAASSNDIFSFVAASPESPLTGPLFFSNSLTDFQVSSFDLLPRGSPPTRTPYLASSSVLAATLCRWLI